MRRTVVLGLLVTAALVFLPLALAPGDLVAASVSALVFREPWETIWAVLVGNYLWGIMPPIEQRLTAETVLTAAGSPLGPITVLVQLALGWAAVLATGTLWRAGVREPRYAYAVVALAVTALLLGSKGFSPQFSTWIIPLVLLVWPNPPPDLVVRQWSVEVEVLNSESTLLVWTTRNAFAAMLVAAIAGGAMALGLALTSRAARANARLAEMRSDFVAAMTH